MCVCQCVWVCLGVSERVRVSGGAPRQGQEERAGLWPAGLEASPAWLAAPSRFYLWGPPWMQGKSAGGLLA